MTTATTNPAAVIRYGVEQIAFEVAFQLDMVKMSGRMDDLALARHIGRSALDVEDVEVARVTALRLAEALDTYDREIEEIANGLRSRVRELFAEEQRTATPGGE